MGGVETDCQVFTALFDIGREEIDGRSLSDYINWLQSTCRLFPGIIVFHDGLLNDHLLDGVINIRVDKGMLAAFKLLPQVREVLTSFKPQSPGDITFLLPEYALVQLSKFELAIRASEISHSKSVLWVDAGLSRFLMDSKTINSVNIFARQLLSSNYRYFFEFDSRKNFNFLRLRLSAPKVGSSKRVIAGGSFWVVSEALKDLNFQVLQRAALWLNLGKWDNEQLILREVIPKLRGKVLLERQGRRQTGLVARTFLENSRASRPLVSRFYFWLMR